ncbi:unnamed protein product, partial [Prorocentrum cordatum]
SERAQAPRSLPRPQNMPANTAAPLLACFRAGAGGGGGGGGRRRGGSYGFAGIVTVSVARQMLPSITPGLPSCAVRLSSAQKERMEQHRWTSSVPRKGQESYQRTN